MLDPGKNLAIIFAYIAQFRCCIPAGRVSDQGPDQTHIKSELKQAVENDDENALDSSAVRLFEQTDCHAGGKQR